MAFRFKLIGNFLLGMFLLLFSACDKTKEIKPLTSPIKKVEVFRVVAEDFQETFVVSGAAEAGMNYRLSTEVGGLLITKHVNRGDKVAKNQILFALDSEPFVLSLRQAKARFAETSARVTFTQAELKRKKPLFQSKTLSQSGWEQLQFDSASAQAEKDRAAVTLAQAKRDLRLTHLQSPYNGQVLEDYYELGEVLAPGSVLAWIADASRIVFEAGVSDKELRYLHLNDRVAVEIDAFPGQTFEGSITQISANPSPKTGSFPIEVSVTNPNQTIIPGMIAGLKFSSQLYVNAIRVPLGAVHQEGGISFVYLASSGYAAKAKVTTDTIFADRIVIKTGLRDGDQVIVLAQRRLRAKDEIEIVH